MSAGKHPYYRYHIINACFTSKQKRYWTMQELMDKLAEFDFVVSLRTVKLDLENMRYDERLGFHVPIKYAKVERAFHYTDPDYSIQDIQLSDEQLRAFNDVVEMLKMFKGTNLAKEFEGAIEKIVRGADQLRIEALAPQEQTIEFERAPYL